MKSKEKRKHTINLLYHLSVIGIILISFIFCTNVKNQNIPKIQGGIFVLRNIGEVENIYSKLDGEWLFLYGNLSIPTDDSSLVNFKKVADIIKLILIIIKIPSKNKFEISLNGKSNQISQEVPFETNGIEMGAHLLEQLLGKTLIVKTDKIIKADFKPLYSQRTDTFFKIMMHRSDNFFAEQTLLMASEKHLGYMSETDIIDTLLKLTFKDIPQQPRWVDGSGLSRYNLFSPKDFIYILNKLQSDYGYEKLEYILPTGGNGTLANYFITDSNFIFAKTGSLSNNFTLCGFIKTRKNRTLLFSLMLNNYIGSGKLVRKQFENYLHEIIQQN